ncbi:hypothetical protein CARUB_v10021485mg [Capsella rubella]|uniref:Uncharacterized protein n=1 Tax=Capsella rubella TaxID=81985 RepID=R0HW06_9BRAS|nr:hypothetical protein CARUB_v10021485mg [Capsella rubella]
MVGILTIKFQREAEGLGIKRLVPAYSKIRRIDSDDLKTGVCFASGGSGIDDLTSKTLKVTTILDTLSPPLFYDYSPQIYTPAEWLVGPNSFYKKFAVLGVMPVGCLPIHRAEFGAFGWCNSYLNKVTQDFNSKLQKGLTSYAVEYEFRGAKFVYVDMYGKLMDLINHPKAYACVDSILIFASHSKLSNSIVSRKYNQIK